MNSPLAHVAAELHRSSGVWTSCDESVRRSVSTDYGGLTQKVPGVVVRPTNPVQVADVLRYANRHSLAVNVRAAGHSIGGQTLNQDGILIETSGLTEISPPQPEELWIEAGAGLKWSHVVATTLTQGLVPPVLTGTFGTTVGGTHSVGGLGHASHRYGAQIDNCLGLELVTAQGEILWCDANVNAELFQHVLGGLGQFGIITRVRHRLRKHRRFIRRWRFFYRQLAHMLRDLNMLAAAGVADYLTGYGFSVEGRFGYSIAALFEVEQESDSEREISLAFITPELVRGPSVETYPEFMVQQPISDGREASRAAYSSYQVINPWVDVFMPADQAASVFDAVVRCFPPSHLRRATMLFWPLARQNFTRPLFMLPAADRLTLGGLYFTVANTDMPASLSALAAATRCMAAAGCKRYVYAWMPHDAATWAQHYGSRWPDLCRLKAQYDPQMILGGGAIAYSAASVAEVTAAAL